MTASQDLFVSEQHPISRRWAIVEDYGRSAWLYLSEPDASKPAADCWLYNHAPTPAHLDTDAVARGEPPIVPATHADETATLSPPAQRSVRLRWSDDGQSVAVLFDAVLIGFIAQGHARGFSKHLRVAGPFGSPLDTVLFERVFTSHDNAA